MSTGTGADSLLGFVIDGPSDRYAVGHPGLYLDEIPTDRKSTRLNSSH